MSFKIITDSCANLTHEQIAEYGIGVVSLTYTVGEKEFLGYLPEETPDYKAFYDMLCGIDCGNLSDIEISVRNHMIAFAAEESRLTGMTVKVRDI